MGVHTRFMPPHRRAEIEAEVERLIALLDAMDGDPDLEPEYDRCAAGDDGCGEFYANGQRLWGSSEDDLGVLTPRYGVDQVAGPINYSSASTEHRAALMGLVRSPSGGWRRPTA